MEKTAIGIVLVFILPFVPRLSTTLRKFTCGKRKMGSLFPPQNHILSHYFFFLEGTVTNPAIWLVLYPVSIFLSLPTGHGNAFVSRRVHPNIRCHFHKYISFSGWVVLLRKHVGPINNLWILSFPSLKSLWLTEKYWFQNEFV